MVYYTANGAHSAGEHAIGVSLCRHRLQYTVLDMALRHFFGI